MSALGDRGGVKGQDKEGWELLHSEMGGLSGVVRTHWSSWQGGRVGAGVTSPQQEQLCQEANSCPHPQLGQRFPSLTQGKQTHHRLSRD